ncbi:MAG: hypothetical protein GXP26_07370 [Planctomycetes bacterium]|nr:hypothetical protein [Planctomycetota bacterium]
MPTQVYRWGGVALCVIAVVGAAQFSTTNAAPDDFGTPSSARALLDSEEGDSQRRLREGTLIVDVVGHFRQDGDGATFVTDDGQEFGGLSNLNLERIARTLKGADESKRLMWSVSGTVTEFMNRNFLLISRAVYKSAAQPPAPDQLSE